MSWRTIATGLFASVPSEVEGASRVVAGLAEIVALMREPVGETAIIVTNVAGGSAVSTIIKRAKAIISTIGGPNSHIVVVARDYQVPCIVGASALDLAVLSSGPKLRLCADGAIQMWSDESVQPGEEHMRVLRNLAFAGAAGSAEDIIGVGSDVSGALTVLAAAGFVDDEGAIAPTPAGLAALDSWYARDRARFDTAACERLHVEFRPLDLRIKKIATEWQDAEARDNWDLRVAATQRLAGLHAETLNFFGRHQALLPRLEEYRTRLSAALERVMNGETDYFVKVAVDSYHTIWFQLHEDLLRLLQKERDAE